MGTTPGWMASMIWQCTAPDASCETHGARGVRLLRLCCTVRPREGRQAFPAPRRAGGAAARASARRRLAAGCLHTPPPRARRVGAGQRAATHRLHFGEVQAQEAVDPPQQLGAADEEALAHDAHGRRGRHGGRDAATRRRRTEAGETAARRSWRKKNR
jgi:hypothetical protein